MATTRATRGQWATERDWLNLRLKITKLYKEDRKPLDQVMRIMERCHHFYATRKMYNKRLKDWGLAKNFKRREVLAMLHAMKQRSSIGKKSEFVIRNEKVDLERMKSYLKRNRSILASFEAGEAAMDLESLRISCRTPSMPQSPSLRTDDTLRQAEELFQTMQAYVNGSFAAGTWSLTPSGACYSRKGCTGDTLLEYIRERLGVVSLWATRPWMLDITRILDPAFHYIKTIVHEQTPRALTDILSLVLKLRQCGNTQLASMMLRYMAEMAETVLGSGHPLHSILQYLLRSMEDREILERFFLLARDVARAHAGESSQFVSEIDRAYFDAILLPKIFEIIGSAQGHHASNIIRNRSDSQPNVDLVTRYLTLLVVLRGHKGSFTEAERAVDAMAAVPNYIPSWECRLRGYLSWGEGKLDEAEMYYREAAQSLQIYSNPLQETRVQGVLYHLETILEEAGKRTEAAEVHQDRLRRLYSFDFDMGPSKL